MIGHNDIHAAGKQRQSERLPSPVLNRACNHRDRSRNGASGVGSGPRRRDEALWMLLCEVFHFSQSIAFSRFQHRLEEPMEVAFARHRRKSGE